MTWSVNGSLAIICPRYGSEVLGGAETVVRQMAEQLAERGLPVEILTTCALDHNTWDNHYREGTESLNGVTVRRFLTQRSDGKAHRAIGKKIGDGVSTTLAEQEAWLNDSFRSAGLFHHLLWGHDRYHTILLTPYMFWTTYACAQIAPQKNVLRPCLHDETFAYLDIYKPIFRSARGVLFNSPPEAELAERIFDLPRNTEVIGEGVEIPQDPSPARFRTKYGIDGDFIIYAGRREWGKNVEQLVAFFGRYSQGKSRDLKLVLLGKGDVHIPTDLQGSVVDLGYVDEQTKHDAFSAATVACQPSRWESFSRLLMDSWLGRTPVLTFGGCETTAYHARTSRGGLVYHDYFEFEAALDLLLENPSLRETMADAGRQYVLENYQWDKVMDRMVNALTSWARPTSQRAQV